jgi:hypothetical protein
MTSLYRGLAYSGWTATGVTMTDIPVNKAQLHGRVGNFDGGRTATWMSGLGEPVWRAVRDAHTGHSIHCVSSRPFAALTADLCLGLSILGWMSATTPVTWYWWDQEWPRVLPVGAVPGKEHLNGGWAVPGVPEVHVYRREEAHKVMIHECIHALGLDIPTAVMDPIRVRFESALGRQLWPHLGEAFTEFYAEWLWSIASSKGIADADKRWVYQLACSEGQAAVVWNRIRGLGEAEDTNVFAYYVLKWVLMQHVGEVLYAPVASAALWFDWWLASKKELDKMVADLDPAMAKKAFPMGMTCLSFRQQQ